MFLGLLCAFHLHSDYGLLKSSPEALIWSGQWWSHGDIKALGCWCWQSFGVPLILAAPQVWTDLFVHLYNAENPPGFERTGNGFVFCGFPLRAQQRVLGCCFRPGGISPVASKSFQALPGVVAWGGGAVRSGWEQRGGEHSQTAFPAPLQSARTTHTEPSPPPVCLAPAKRAQKGNQPEKHPFFLEFCWPFPITCLAVALSPWSSCQRHQVLVPPCHLGFPVLDRGRCEVGSENQKQL